VGQDTYLEAGNRQPTILCYLFLENNSSLTVMNIALVSILVVHGLIHLLGFVKAFGLAPVAQLKRPITRTAGAFWLAAAVLLFGAGVLVAVRVPSWGYLAAAGVGLSQILIVLSWTDAKWGTVGNLLLLLPAIAGVLSALPTSYASRFHSDVQQRLMVAPEPAMLTEQDLQHLPLPVQNYLRFTGSVGKPRVVNVRVTWRGSMRTKLDGDWLPIRAWQVNFFDDPARLFYIESSMYGLPFDGYHVYAGNTATMQIKVGGLVQVVDARGPEMNRGETVTMFNDMCLLAPATLISPAIRWEEIDSVTVRGFFSNQGNTVSAILTFDPSGALRNFVSNDRYLSEDGKSYLSYPWSTPVGEYREFGGRKIASVGEAIWHMPQGEYAYGRFTVGGLDVNCREAR
jgi:hypothetical protein